MTVSAIKPIRSSSSDDALVHVLFFALPLYGHARPMLSLAINLLTLFPHLHITFCCMPMFQRFIEGEITSHEPEADVMKRLKVVPIVAASDAKTVVEQNDPRMGAQLKVFQSGLPGLLKNVLEAKRSAAGAAGFSERPKTAVVDSFFTGFDDIAADVLESLHLDTQSLRRVAFFPINAVSAMHFFASSDYADYGIVTRIARWTPQVLADHPEMSPEDASLEAVSRVEDKIIELPTLPPMYDYEFLPQRGSCPPPADVAYAFLENRQIMNKAVAGVCTTLPDFEPEVAEEAGRAIFGPKGKMLLVGPQFTPNQWSGHLPPVLPEQQPIIDFCDRILNTHGPQSLLYISLGSLFWPFLRPDLMTTIVDTLIELKQPFLLAAGSPLCVLEEGVRERAAKSGVGMITAPGVFAPQQHVLAHRATGIILTHGGSGGCSEALLNAVPMIFWPFTGDQPHNVAQYVKLGLGIELVQVRTFAVGKPLATGGKLEGTKDAMVQELKEVLEAMMGGRGQEIRARIKECSEVQRKSYESGQARQHLIEFARLIL